MRSEVWLVIAGMAIVTYFTRAPLLFVLARRPLPPRLRLWLRLIPLAVLPAIALPMVLVERDAAGARLALSVRSSSKSWRTTCSSPSPWESPWWRCCGRWRKMLTA